MLLDPSYLRGATSRYLRFVYASMSGTPCLYQPCAPAGKSGSKTAEGRAAQSEGGKKGGKATAKKDKAPAEKATNGKGGGKDPSKTPGGKASGAACWLCQAQV